MSVPSTTATATTNALPARSKAVRLFSNIITYICHPLWLPLLMGYAIIYLFPAMFAGISAKDIGYFYINIIITAIFFPIVSILLMKGLGFITSLKLNDSKERIIPLMAIMIFYFWLGHVFNHIPKITVPVLFKAVYLGNFWAIAALFLLNIFTKVSMHTTGWGGIVGVFAIAEVALHQSALLPVAVAVVILGVVALSRYLLGAHTKSELVLGVIVGLIAQVAAYAYYA
ncbi:MAG: hypothetical protein EBX41_05530 [Chitinophagia bacterium]|nr:hypothetical protein [Chitinophagia bacterium]